MEMAPQQSEVGVDSIGVTTKDPKPAQDPPLKLGKLPSFGCPKRAAELTPEWLTSALRFRKLLADDVSVTAVTHQPIGDGVMGDISAVTLTYSGETSAPPTLVAKFSPAGKAPLPGILINAVFTAETHFYNDFTVASGGLLRPECYLALHDAKHSGIFKLLMGGMPRFLMLLQDMRPASIFSKVQLRPTDQIATLNDKDALMGFMAGIARMHARWWGHKKGKPLQWCTHPSKDMGGLILRGFMHGAKTGLPALKECYPDTYKPLHSWLPLLKRRHRFIVTECLREPLTLTHGDAHIENAFFDKRFEPGGLAFIDFGNMMFSPGTSDIAFFMVHSLDVEVRRAHEEDCVKHYHEQLLANGVDGKEYPYERCWHDYRFNMWRALLSVCMMGPGFKKQKRSNTGMWAPPESITDGDKKQKMIFEELNRRVVAALIDHKWDELLVEESGPPSCGLCSGISFCY